MIRKHHPIRAYSGLTDILRAAGATKFHHVCIEPFPAPLGWVATPYILSNHLLNRGAQRAEKKLLSHQRTPNPVAKVGSLKSNDTCLYSPWETTISPHAIKAAL